jgi:hypothetical protein
MEAMCVEERIERECKAFPDVESKVGDYRLLDGAVVSVDYGLAHKDLVCARRAFYTRMAGS